MITFGDLKTKLRAENWPAGEPRPLRAVHNTHFVRAMYDLQKWVPCLRQNNTTVIPFCATYFERCGKSVMAAPLGEVRRIYTIANSDWCNLVHYRPSNIRDIECWANDFSGVITPVNEGLPALQKGFKYAEATSDYLTTGRLWGRARIGLWAIHNKRLVLAPWIQSSEQVVIEWDGWKREWEDTDVLDTDYWSEDAQNAIALYVRHAHELAFGEDRQVRQDIKAAYDEALGDLMHWCREQTKQRADETCDSPRVPSVAEVDSEEPVTPETSVTIGIIGDWGADNANAAAVAASLIAAGPSIIVTTGDNVYDDGPLFDTLYPDQTIYPSWGNHDIDYGLAALKALFTLNNDEENYDFVYGPIHFFVINSDPRSDKLGYVDPTTSTEAFEVGEWLRVKAALSSAYWKIVVFHHVPYSSGTVHGPSVWMQWPFDQWGIDAVLSGHEHNYEYLVVDGVNYFVNGAGGKSLYAFGAPASGSVFRYAEDFGYQILTATCEALGFEFFKKDGTSIHAVSITKP